MAGSAKLGLKPRRVPVPAAASDGAPWRVLVADDDDQVHAMTAVLLRDFVFDGRPFVPVTAHSAGEAAAILAADPTIPVALLDVVMETDDSGLKLVRHIRDDLKNHTLRIILRTGQPGEAPEREVILAYDVNDYKSKAELTAQKLFTALVGAVRAWRDIVQLAELNASLERQVADRTQSLARAKDAAELALARETAAKGQLRQFLSMMSHEFRTPLAIIDSAAQMLLRQIETLLGAESMRPRLDGIRGGVGRLVRLIDTCLTDEQLDSGRIVLHEEVIDLSKVLCRAVAWQRQAAPQRHIDLAPQAIPAVWGDSGLLELVFANLVANAIKYSPSGGPITVDAAEDDGMIRVTVADCGIGIPADELTRVFDRFFRASNVGGFGGSGLGLHMARQIVELHGGTIAVANRIGDGTTVTVRLRVAPGRQAF
jgi:signal transduction histidine kinase